MTTCSVTYSTIILICVVIAISNYHCHIFVKQVMHKKIKIKPNMYIPYDILNCLVQKH